MLLTARDRARRWENAAEISAYGTALKIIDACIVADEGEIFSADAGRDRQLMVRLREIASVRDIFASERPKEKEAAE